MGGAFILTCLLSFIFCNLLSQQVAGILLASAIMLFFGIIDDFKEFSVGVKFFVQIIATSILFLFGVKTQIAFLGNILNAALTFIWVIGITNAFNLLDVADGLAAGIALIASLSFLTVSILNADINSLIISLSLIGPIAAFLIYNKPPAKVYIGNSGSHLLGFVLAALALLISFAPISQGVSKLEPALC